MTDILIEEISPPAELDDSPAARDFVAAVEVGNAAETAALGFDDLTHSAEESLSAWRDLEHAPKRLLVARLDGRVVGSGTMEWRTDEAQAGESWQGVAVHPAAQGRGIGRALADRMEDLARAEGRTRIIARPNTRYGDGEQLIPASGAGSIPRDDRLVRFLEARGYRFEQITRMSRLDLPPDGALLDRLYDEALIRAGHDYRLHEWRDRTPPEWVEDMAMLMTRLSSDVPVAGVPLPDIGGATVWTTEMYLREEETVAASPSRLFTTAVEHVPSGRLVGFTSMFVPDDPDHAISQGATLVTGEHRGHRLSMLVKVANARHLARAATGHRAITTGNAEENRFMLDVNEAMGFVPIAASVSWTKRL